MVEPYKTDWVGIGTLLGLWVSRNRLQVRMYRLGCSVYSPRRRWLLGALSLSEVSSRCQSVMTSTDDLWASAGTSGSFFVQESMNCSYETSNTLESLALHSHALQHSSQLPTYGAVGGGGTCDGFNETVRVFEERR